MNPETVPQFVKLDLWTNAIFHPVTADFKKKERKKKVFFGPRVDESSYKHGFKESGPHFLSKWKINV